MFNVNISVSWRTRIFVTRNFAVKIRSESGTKESRSEACQQLDADSSSEVEVGNECELRVESCVLLCCADVLSSRFMPQNADWLPSLNALGTDGTTCEVGLYDFIRHHV